MIDLFCGGLSTGAIGDAVRPLYGDPKVPYGCAHFFLAIDVGHFRDPDGFAGQASDFARRVRESKRAPGVERLYAPGEPAQQVRLANAGFCPIAAGTARELEALAAKLDLQSNGIFSNS